METGANKVSVVVRITGSEADIGMLASSLTSLQGQMILRPKAVPADALLEAWWAIEVTQHNQESTEVVIVEALNRLKPMHAVIQNVANDPRFQIELDCTVWIEKERPVIEVSPFTLKRLVDLRVALGFEVHDCRE